MNNSRPSLVSCIMPTFNRRKFVPLALQYFSRQSYEDKELIIIDDGTDPVLDLIPNDAAIRYHRLAKKITLGEKLNLACELAKGDIIVHWDDDDWYDPSRITYQVNALQAEGADVCGINHLLYFNITTKAAYQYIYPPDERTWLLGSSLCYTKSSWKQNRFAPINVGMDALFVWATPAHRVKCLPNKDMAVHMIHKENVSPKDTTGTWWHQHPLEDIQRVLQKDWHTYSNGRFASPAIKGLEVPSYAPPRAIRPVKNIYACLVHEKEDCVIDLVRNLHFHDPDSRIILYNGGKDHRLLSGKFPYEKFGCHICPEPLPVSHGYLHPFALKAMKLATELGDFETFTVVDSDQLAIKKGYTNVLTDYFNSHPKVGLLSNKPEKISPTNGEVWTASQAFKEYDLWKPLLKQFPNGEDKFVHWSFWPSTAFTRDAVNDLLQLFEENSTLQEIIKKTKIWATEEVILPTLISLLGYEIGLNPCNHNFVNYQKYYSIPDLHAAEKDPNAYWIHPVHREYDDPIRKEARQRFQHYVQPSAPAKEVEKVDLPMVLPLLEEVKKIDGWLADQEADLLIASTLKTCCSLPAPHRIVEVGSYQGKSTVVLGKVVKALFPTAKVFAIDPHEGIVGAADQGLQKAAPTLEKFMANIRAAGLEKNVTLIKDYSYQVDWTDPISFLFIDGLHDYPNVSRDFWKFSPYVLPGGLIAFHDYADYYPGVKALVDEILLSGEFKRTHLAESLMVVQKV